MATLCGDCTSLSLVYPKGTSGATIINLKPGGFKGFLVSTVPFPSAVGAGAQAIWEAAIEAGTMAGRLDGCLLKGGKALGTPNTVNVGACGTDITIDVTDAYTIVDSGYSNTGTITEFYSYLRLKGTCYYWAFIDCDNYARYIGRPISVAGGENIPDVSQGAVIDNQLTVTIKSDGSTPTPSLIPFLDAITAALQVAP